MQKVEIYCDESRPDLFTTTSHEKDNYLLIGGLKLLAKHRESIKESIKNLRKKYNIYSEIKWNKVSRNKIEFYKELIDIFFLFKDNLRFRCIAVEAKKMDVEHFHDNDAELGFYKFYYQLLNHWILDYNNYKIFTDLKTNREKNRLNILNSILNNTHLFSYISSIQALPSHQVVLLQLTDLLLGLAGARLNNSCDKNSSKMELLKYFEKKLKQKIKATPKDELKYNVFVIILQNRW